MKEPVLAETALGRLQGARKGGVLQFRGVPYAAAPVGALRFRAPQPAKAWSGVRDATRHGPIAPQFPARLRGTMGDFSRPQSEDCLTVTISTPAADDAKRPVLVWFHGGGYMSGAGSLDWYDGATLAESGDIVVVGVNYRLGALGFLHLPEVTEGVPGLDDMIAALAWVRAHIAAFGGDPDRITLAGQSGGAHAIMCMLTMPAVRRLFQRAILQSAPAGMAPLSASAAIEYGEQLLRLLGVDGLHAAKRGEALRSTTPEALLEAQMKLVRAAAKFADLAPPFVPMIDALASRNAFIDASASGAGASKIDLIIGTTREETHSFYCDASLPMPAPTEEMIAARFATPGGGDPIAPYRHRFPGASLTELLSQMVTDETLLLPSLRLAERATAAGARAWVYQFDWAPPASPLKACHCIELPFVFGNPEAWTTAPMLAGAGAEALAPLSGAVRAAWAGLVHGKPPSPGAPWPPYGAARETMIFGPVVGVVSDPAGAARREHFPL